MAVGLTAERNRLSALSALSASYCATADFLVGFAAKRIYSRREAKGDQVGQKLKQHQIIDDYVPLC